MSEAELIAGVVMPLALGLFGFVEPCSIGATLLFIKLMEDRPAAVKLAQVATFTLVRAGFIGLLGALAALVGAVFLGLQKAGWLVLGLVYLAIGAAYLTGHAGGLMRTIGPRLAGLGDVGASATLGVVFGLNIPACAAPLLLALLAASASGVTFGGVAGGFAALALFGLALSLPLAAAVLFPRARGWLDALAHLTGRMPRWTGGLMVVLGLWSVWFGLFVSLE